MPSNFRFLVPTVLLVPLLTGLGAIAVLAQQAETPSPSSNGDFPSAFVLGNRGYYPNYKWLVIDPSGLNCRRSPNGEVRSRIQFGAAITAVFTGPANQPGQTTPNTAADAIVSHNNSPWLRVTGTDPLTNPTRPDRRNDLGTCYVRANLKYIAPINPESMPITNPRP